MNRFSGSRRGAKPEGVSAVGTDPAPCFFFMLKRFVSFYFICSALCSLSACGGGGSSDAQPNYHDPTQPIPPYFSPDGTPSGNGPYQPQGAGAVLQGEPNFAKLVIAHPQAQVTHTPWAGYWWPYAEGGTSNACDRIEQSHGASGAINWEINNHGPSAPGIQSWWGHCNGWAAASTLFVEPQTTYTDASGIDFKIGDQKAALSEIAMEVHAESFGHRANSDDSTSLDFQDVFPDQFFLVMMNVVGLGNPLIMDRYTGSQVWNQPIVAYQLDPITPSDYIGADPSAPNVYRVEVTMTVWWASDNVTSEHVSEAFAWSDGPSYESRVYRFELWLDAPVVFDATGSVVSSGNVVLNHQGDYVLGGDWKMSDSNPVDSYPDYLWIVHDIAPSSGYSNPHLDQAWITSRFGKRLR